MVRTFFSILFHFSLNLINFGTSIVRFYLFMFVFLPVHKLNMKTRYEEHIKAKKKVKSEYYFSISRLTTIMNKCE